MANVFFRYDTWVSSATGPAIPGAQVYVCTQPANTASTPPSPLAAIYSDSGGLVPITQPIITDGFGHADFYALPGLYTVIIAIGGIIQDILPDQTLGGVGTSGGGGGTPATTLLLESNGVPNAVQSLQNLYSSDGSITVTADTNGNVDLQASSVQTVPFMAGAGYTEPPLTTLSGFHPGGGASLNVLVTRFGWQSSLKFNTICFSKVGGTSNIHFIFGIYSGATAATPGVLLWSSGDIAVPNSSGVMEVTVPQYTLAPGDYYIAMTTNVGDGGTQVIGVPMTNVISGNTNIFNQSIIGCGSATNPATFSTTLTLPPTLGTVTANSGGDTAGWPMVMFYNLPV